MSLNSQLDSVAQFRARQLARHALFEVTDASLKAVRDDFETRVVKSEGHLEVLRGQGRVRGFYLDWFEPESWFGVPTHWIITDALIDDVEAQNWAWCLAKDRAFSNGYPAMAHVEWHAPSWNPRLIEALKEPSSPFGVDSIQLVGRVAQALDALSAPSVEWPCDVAVEDLSDVHLDRVMNLWSDVFGAEPEWCWFGANPSFLEGHRRRLEKPCAIGRRVALVQRDRVLGFVGWDASERPGWGRTAGVGLLFARELRGRGLLRHVYRRILREMDHAGVLHFSGGTCQKPVLHLGVEMGRQANLIHLHRRSGRRPDYFSPYLDE